MINILILKLKLSKQMLPVILIMTGMALLFIFIFGNGFSSNYVPLVAVVDEDNSEASNQIIKRLESQESYRYEYYTYEEAVDKLDGGNILSIIHIQEGFQESLEFPEDIKMTIYKETDAIEQTVLERTINGQVSEFMINRGFSESFAAGFSGTPIKVDADEVYETLLDTLDNHPSYIVNVLTQEMEVTDSYDATKHSFVGFLVFFALFTITFGIGSIVDEKQNHVWSRQLVGPSSIWQMILGNLIGNFILGIGQLTLIIVVAKYAFSIDLGGSILGLLMVFAAYSLAGTALGLFIAGFLNSEQQLSAILPTIVVSTSMLGGCMWPLSIISNKFLLFLADLTPQRWAYQGIANIVIGNGRVEDVLQPTLYLLIFTTIFLCLSVIPFSRPATND